MSEQKIIVKRSPSNYNHWIVINPIHPDKPGNEVPHTKENALLIGKNLANIYKIDMVVLD